MTIFTQEGNVVTALAPDADGLSGTVNTDFITMEKFESIMHSLQIGVGATGTTLITVNAASDAGGTGAEAIAFRHNVVADTTASDVPGAIIEDTSAGFTTTAGSNQIYNIFVDGEDLPEDKPFIQLDMVEAVDSPVDVAVLAVLTNPRYTTDVPESAIA